ncbi:hypothetical protein CsatB_007889 [Cannabis sativa]|uniref:Hydroxyproline-rich glycoprotein family protein n=2 Tax=Cannabis sativa TaxID=3483 RepID=A0A7J6DTI1_CANSA|nr:uncharacterized protein At1g76660 [Cannabis sativa]KAF4349397.1 hypothetical protein F8388_012567 [Cannabis sativa]KAF4370490.1 hypothetical protein G4B88_005211 [Cannabis sativa]
MGSEQNRFPQHQEAERRKRWGGCLSALSCFGTQKGGKRIVPASRIPEGNGSATQPNGHPHGHGHGHGHGHPHGPQPNGLPSQPTALLAPPSSPASFTNSALPSTAQSPTNGFLSLSANSPGGPSSSMYATGPYAHETQLVSPPVFSTFTTEPSTAPLTPPPELAHLTTPSSPDVPFAHFLSSTGSGNKTSYIGANDLQATYSLYPGSPPTPSSLISPQNGKCELDHENAGAGAGAASAVASTQDSNFFCPATFAQFYLDNPPFPNSGGRLSVSKDSDVHNSSSSAAVNGNQNQNSRQMKSPKQDAEEIEAYRASFGFSADEIITTPQYVEISDVMEDSFTMKPPVEVRPDHKRVQGGGGDSNKAASGGEAMMISDEEEEEDIFSSSKMRRYPMGMSSSDAEIDYRRGRSLREKRFQMA